MRGAAVAEVVAVAGASDSPRGTARAITCLVLAAGIATLGMLSGGETPIAEADPEDGQTPPGYFAESLPRYPGVAEYPMGTRMRVGEEDMKMAYFVTRDPPIRVAEFYARFWEGRGLRVSQEVSPSGGTVGCVDPAAGAMSVSIVRRGSMTYAFPSLLARPVRVLDAGDLTDGGEIAAFPGSDGAVRFTADDDGRGSEVLSYGNWAGVRDNVDYYRREMSRRGWHEGDSTAPEEARGGETLRFTRRAEKVDVAIAPVDREQGRVRVLVTRTRGW